MQDRWSRSIDYLRLSVTDRCNLRCRYCMPEEGVRRLAHEQILRLEELERLARVAVRLGIRRIRVTGGEPLVRKGIVPLMARLAGIAGLDDLAMTTNGILLGAMAPELKAAGLQRVNISMDSLRPERFRAITRGGAIDAVWAGIDGALAAGLNPIKLNVVVIGGFNDDELVDFARLTLVRPIHVRFIEWMPMGASRCSGIPGCFVGVGQMEQTLMEAGLRPEPVSPVRGAGPAAYRRLPGALGTIGFIGALSQHFCAACNRLRLTADGHLRPCLDGPVEFDLKGLLRLGVSDRQLAAIFRRALAVKPAHHEMITEPWKAHARQMSQIGG
ncbi:GTP 3',8-cyclase MoaA [Heliophilum fasciatum]|uniref:GTP 3',8-cyclase n=1 Tax=Heliophilum fasciatum TaxID=35700 RepID=A0A4R2SCX3_9FIRM|nr:GTP 3',8-cyclase MoaA [Heliophilum fasciatum]MCW2276632.1 cyclic pyranopterin phosphate synthase [Heliophilum fasciatum]TCP68985.1 cyclic pyranopterin monophosphate synthase subunit MoaA [Heliophilum fasciatum]